MDYVRHWTQRAEVTVKQMLQWLGLAEQKFYEWTKRYGKLNEHNGQAPRDTWLEPWEKAAILKFHQEHPGAGYRRLTYLMMDRDIVAVSPATTYRVLKAAGCLSRGRFAPSKKGTGFQQPFQAHEHWHVDVSYLNLQGTFYYLTSVLDGYSRAIVHWEIRAQMTEADVQTILQRAREKHPAATPRIISDNGPQFLAKEFKEFVRQCGMTHVRTSPYYPESNGKIERWHQSLKRECIRPQTPLCLEDARRIVTRYVREYNDVRLHGALGYITPSDMLAGKAQEIQAERDRKLAQAREARRQRRRAWKEQQRKASRGPGAAMSHPGLRERQPVQAAQPLPLPALPNPLATNVNHPVSCPL